MTTKPVHGRVETLDLLRLVAALVVVAYHYCFRGAAADDMTWLSLPVAVPIVKYGFLGVELFFVISGFVIAYSAEGRNVREFVVARAARIYPGFLAAMTVTFLVVLAFGAPRYQTSAAQWLANLVIVAPALKQPFMDGVYWSIVFELVFYAWTAAMIAAGWFPRRLPLIVVAWLAISLTNELGLGSNAIRRLFITDGSGFFAAGLILYALFSGRRNAITWLLLAVATGVGVLQGNGDADWVRNHFGIELSAVVVAVLSISAIGLVGAALLIRRVPIPMSVLIAAGGITYPLYLLHQMVGFIAFNRLQGFAPPAVLLIAVLSVMIAASYAIYRYIERPGQKALRAWLSRLLRFSPPSVSPAPARTALQVPIYGPVRLPRAAVAAAPEGATP